MSFTPNFDLVALRDLPASMTREIGRVCVAWAYYETLLQRTIYDLLDLPTGLGRLAIVERRGQDQIDLIYEISRYLELSFPNKLRLSLRQRTADVKTTRDLAAHGIWHKDAKGHFVLNTRGNWNDKDYAPLSSVPRKIAPKGQRYGLPQLVECHAEINRLIDDVGSLRASLVEQHQASRETPEQHPPD